MLDIRSLSVHLAGAQPLREVSLSLGAGETLGLVGESGSGKSMLALAVIGLLPAGARTGGAILFEGRDLLALPEREMRRLRGGAIAMVFQEPATALNPAMRVGAQIAEAVRLHRPLGRGEASAEALRLLDEVRMPDAARRLHAYPHELSGGQRQRVGIAIALGGNPRLLLADEPTTALDATVQREILDLLRELTRARGLSTLLVSHDLAVIAEMAGRVHVLREGRTMEQGETGRVLGSPASSYTRELLRALPKRTRRGLGLPAGEGA